MPPIIYIHWRDANYSVEDTDHRELGSLLDVYEFGWLIKETDESYVVCAEWSEDATSSRLAVTIPKVNVVKARVYRFETLMHRGRSKKTLNPTIL